MGLDLAIVFELLGVGVIAFGALCGWVASRETLPQSWARVIFAADIAWVAGSVLVLALPATWTMAGVIGIVVVALIVADLAILEYLGLRRLGYGELGSGAPFSSHSSPVLTGEGREGESHTEVV